MIEINEIGKIRSGFTEKFGIPRQSGLCPSLKAQIVLDYNRFNEEAVRELDQYSHIWVIFYFHMLKKQPDKARVRPPRLGGNKYVGVYSSRSPYRPNPIGLSMVELESIEEGKKEIILNIRNHDLLNETPILDIKPVVSTDLPTADPNFGWQKTEWNTLEVTFSADIKASKKIKEIVTDILRQDPRPAYDKTRENNKIYKMSFDNLNINFTVNSSICTVLKIFE